MVAYVPPTGHRTRLFDVSTTGEIVFASWPESDIDAGTYHHLRREGDAWIPSEIVASGRRFGGHEPANYLGGVSFPNPADGSVWLSREEADTWSIERWTRRGDDWTLADTAASSRIPLARPYCPIGASSGPAVIWNQVEYYAASALWMGDSMDWSGN